MAFKIKRTHKRNFHTTEKHLHTKGSKDDTKSVLEIKQWIFDLLNEPVPSQPLIEVLKNGIILCRLANTLQEAENGIKCAIKWVYSDMPYVHMEQINQFLSFVRSYGLPEDELFQAIDLYEKCDQSRVYRTLRYLSRCAHLRQPERFKIIGPGPTSKRPHIPVRTKVDRLRGIGWSTHEYSYRRSVHPSINDVFAERKGVQKQDD